MSQTLSNSAGTGDPVARLAALHVDVIADLACPFCFIGKRRLDRAMTAVQGPSAVSWYPFQVNPEIDPHGQPFDVYLTRRFGSPANVEPVLQHLVEEGTTVGIDFRFDKLRHVPNTLAAHQVMQFAETIGANQSSLAEDFLSAFFEQGRNIGERGELIDIAGAHGISATDTARAIDSQELRRIVTTRERQVREGGLAGVPGFLINRRLLVVGAQSSDNIVGAFDRAMFGAGTDELVSPALH